MKKIFLLSINFFTLQFLLAQTPAWDSSFRPSGYQLKVEQFRSYNQMAIALMILQRNGD